MVRQQTNLQNAIATIKALEEKWIKVILAGAHEENQGQTLLLLSLATSGIV